MVVSRVHDLTRWHPHGIEYYGSSGRRRRRKKKIRKNSWQEEQEDGNAVADGSKMMMMLYPTRQIPVSKSQLCARGSRESGQHRSGSTKSIAWRRRNRSSSRSCIISGRWKRESPVVRRRWVWRAPASCWIPNRLLYLGLCTLPAVVDCSPL